MREAKPSPMFAKIVRVAIVLAGGVILLAGYQKLIGVVDLSPTLQYFGLPRAAHSGATLAIAAMELFWGASLVWFQLHSRVLMWVSIIILLCFSGLIGALLFSAKAPSCGCVSLLAEFESARLNNVISLGRNVLLITVAMLGMRLAGQPESPSRNARLNPS